MNKKNDISILIPVFGTILFIILYIVATKYYPGGSQNNINTPGFSWKHNYWCNMLDHNAMNGSPNPSRPIAVAGALVLCFTLTFFWYHFPGLIQMGKISGAIVRISGITAMSSAIFLFTAVDHDLITQLASGFGLIATVGTIFGLYQAKYYGLFIFGLINILLVIINNYVYYSSELIVYLPVIQKSTFLSFLAWICFIVMALYRKRR